MSFGFGEGFMGRCLRAFRGRSRFLGVGPWLLSLLTVLLVSEGPSTQYSRTLVPNTISLMIFGTRVLDYWALGRTLWVCFLWC